jgi:hypothetical protein
LLYLDVRLLPRGSDREVQTKPVEIEAAMNESPRSFRLNPTKLPGVLLDFQENIERYVRLYSQLKMVPSATQRSRQTSALNNSFNAVFKEIQRFLSATAASLYPNTQIISVRGTFASRAIIPFSDRYEKPQPTEPIHLILRTVWLPFVQGVAR